MSWYSHFVGAVTVVALGSCGDQLDILDAAEIYRNNQAVFEGVREHFPGPFTEARRIPAFNEKEDSEDIRLFKTLQQKIPAEYIWTSHSGGSDKINVVLGAYGLGVSGSSVSVVYFENFDREEVVEPGIEVFDRCDERSLDWLRTDHKTGFADAYCRLNEYWYAYQDVN